MREPVLPQLHGDKAIGYRDALREAHEYCNSLVADLAEFDGDGMPGCMYFLRHAMVMEAREAKKRFEELLVTDDYGTGEDINRARIHGARMCRGFECSYDIMVRDTMPWEKSEPKSI